MLLCPFQVLILSEQLHILTTVVDRMRTQRFQGHAEVLSRRQRNRRGALRDAMEAVKSESEGDRRAGIAAFLRGMRQSMQAGWRESRVLQWMATGSKCFWRMRQL